MGCQLSAKTRIILRTDASIPDRMKIPMPAAVLAGGASRRMGRSKAALAYGAGTLLEFQTARLASLFEDVFVVAKNFPDFPIGPARVVLDRIPDFAPLYGVLRALEETVDRAFILAVDLPALPADVIRLIGERGLRTPAAVLVPRSGGLLQPLAAVWRHKIRPLAETRIARGARSLHELAEEAGAEVLAEEEWRAIDPSGNSFVNINTLEDYAAMRERA